MSYSAVVRQQGFQLPSPPRTTSTASPADTAPTSPPPDASSTSSESLFMPHNVSFLPDSFRKFPSTAQAHASATPTGDTTTIDFADDELASLIDPHPHISSHERSTHSHSPSYDDTYRHNIFDISAPTSAHHHGHHPLSPPAGGDIYHPSADLTHPSFASTLNSSLRYDSHTRTDPSPSFVFRHTPSPSHRSRSRSRAPSIGPTRTARRDRRANSISSHVSSTSPPPRPHPHAIVIPGRNAGPTMGGFFVPGGNSCPPAGEYSLPTPDSLSQSFGFGSAHANSHGHSHSHSHAQFQYASPSSPYYSYTSIGRTGTPTGSMGISPTDVETTFNAGMGVSSMNGMNGLGSMGVHLGTPASSIQASSLPATSSILSSSLTHHHMPSSLGGTSAGAKPHNGTSSGSKSTGTGTGSGANAGTEPVLDSQLSEKRRRRRESHNAVERRRRDNINERIGELAGLIPGVLFECDAPLVLPNVTLPPSATSPTDPPIALNGSNAGSGIALPMGMGEDLFSMGLLGDASGMHVIQDTMDGLPDLPEESIGSGSVLKKDPCEDGELAGSTNANANGNGHNSPPNGGIPTNGTTTSPSSGEQQTIKANKGMILRKSVEYIRYLQQLVSFQATRGRDLEERNRVLEKELAMLRGSGTSITPGSSSASTTTTSAATSGSGSPSRLGSGHHQGPRGHRKDWSGGYELASMPEDMEVEDDVCERDDHEGGGPECDGEEEGERRGRQRVRGSGTGARVAMGMAVAVGRVGSANGRGSNERGQSASADMEM